MGEHLFPVGTGAQLGPLSPPGLAPSAALSTFDALGLPGQASGTHMANVSHVLSAAWVLVALEGYQQHIGAFACGGAWGCILSGGDIQWVSLCAPMRPGKNSFVAPLRIRMPRGPPVRTSRPCLHLYVLAGFVGVRLHYLAPWNPVGGRYVPNLGHENAPFWVHGRLGCLCLVAGLQGVRLCACVGTLSFGSRVDSHAASYQRGAQLWTEQYTPN